MFGNALTKSKPALQAPPQLAVVTPKNGDEFSRAADWDTSRIEQIEKSERKAWKVAGVGATLAMLAMIISALLILLKEPPTTMMVRVDNATGAVDVTTVLSDQRISYEDVLDKYWLSKFVRARETYDWNTLQRDYDETRLLASAAIGREYTNLFEGENALDKLYGKQTRMTVEIVTAVPDGKGAATVRYILTKARAEDPSSGKSSYHTATLAYEYLKPSKLTVKERQLNPLGFQVTSYRSDEDFTAPARTSAPKATGEDSE